MRPSRSRLSLIALSVLVSGTAGALLLLHSHYSVDSVARIGQPLPALTLTDQEGRQVDFDRYLGRKLLAVFVDPECGFCQDQFQVLLEFSSQASPDDHAVVAVVRQDAVAPVDISAHSKLPFPVWVDTRGQLRKKLGVMAVPALLLLDERGVLRHMQVGYQTRDDLAGLFRGHHTPLPLLTTATP